MVANVVMPDRRTTRSMRKAEPAAALNYAAPTQTITTEELEEMQQLREWQRGGHLTKALFMFPRVAAYLNARNINVFTAANMGVGYIPPSEKIKASLRRWCDHLIFPTASPAGIGYYGYAMTGWEPGMGIEEHFARRKSVPQWQMTGYQGWFGYEGLRHAAFVVASDDPFDTLTFANSNMLPPGMCPVALHGTVPYMNWIPDHVAWMLMTMRHPSLGLDLPSLIGHTHLAWAQPDEAQMAKSWRAYWNYMAATATRDVLLQPLSLVMPQYERIVKHQPDESWCRAAPERDGLEAANDHAKSWYFDPTPRICRMRCLLCDQAKQGTLA